MIEERDTPQATYLVLATTEYFNAVNEVLASRSQQLGGVTELPLDVKYSFGRTDSKVKPKTWYSTEPETDLHPHGHFPRCEDCADLDMPQDAWCTHLSFPGYLIEEGVNDYRIEEQGVALVNPIPANCPLPYFDIGELFRVLILRQRVYYKDSPVFGERTWTLDDKVTEIIKGTEKVSMRDATDHATRAVKGLGLLRLAGNLGRPIGSGTYSDADSLVDAVLPIMCHLISQGITPTYDNVSERLNLSRRYFVQLVKRFMLDWQQLKHKAIH